MKLQNVNWRRVEVAFLIVFGIVGTGAWRNVAAGSQEGRSREPVRGSRPNVLLIVLDTARADHLSCYGYRKETSPNIDRLAREGTLYENCISAGSWTLPSFASIFTGLYLRDHKVSALNLRLAPEMTTMAEIFQRAGYATVAYSCNAWLGPFSGMDQGFEEYHEIWRGLGSSTVDDGAEQTNERIREWLELADESKPFFMFVLYFEPHFPYHPPPPYSHRFLPESVNEDRLAQLRKWKHPRELGYVLRAPGMEVTPEEFGILQSQYDGEIAYVDSRVGKLVRDLEKKGLLDNTILVITADHGEHFGEHHLMDHKMSLYDPVIRVPLIIRYPRKVPTGARVTSQVQTVSILPTLLLLAEIASANSVGLTQRLPFNNFESGMEFAFSEFERPDIFLDVMKNSFPLADSDPFARALKSVRTLERKLIWASDGRHELYDLGKDPGETDNLYLTNPDLAIDLERALDDFSRRILPMIPRPPK